MIVNRDKASTEDVRALAASLRGSWDAARVNQLRAAGPRGLEALLDQYRSPLSREQEERLDQALAQMGRAAAPRLIALLDDPDLSAVGAWALGVIKDARAVKPLIRLATTGPSPTIRATAGRALGMFRDRRAFETFVTLLEDEETRLVAIEGLARLGDQRAVESLLPYADGNAGPAGYARTVIQQLRGVL